MILTCPECATSYFVDDAKVGFDGRNVRCHSCKHRWFARVQPEMELSEEEIEPDLALEAEPEPELEPEPQEVSDLPAEELPKVFRARAEARRNIKVAAATGAVWAVMGAMLLAVVGFGYLFRVDVVRFFPKAASAYAAIRIPVNPVGLDFEDVTARPALKDGHAALIISGKIRNVVDESVPAPPVRITVIDTHGKPVVTKIADPQDAAIPSGETRHFVITLLDPPTTSKDAIVTFALDIKAHPTGHAPAKAGEPKMELRGAMDEAHEASPAPAAAPAHEPVPHAAPAAPAHAAPAAEAHHAPHG